LHTASLFSSENITELKMLDEIYHSGVTCITFSPDGRYLASGASDGSVRLWRVNPSSHLESLECESRVNALSFHPDGKHLVAGLNNGEVKIWHLNLRYLTQVSSTSFDSGLGGIGAVAFSRDGELLVAGGDNGRVKAWAFPRCAPVSDVRLSSGMVFSLDFHPSDLLVAIGVMRIAMNIDLASAWLWDLSSERARPILGHISSVFTVRFSPRGEILATGGGDGVVSLWKVPRLSQYAFWQEKSEIGALEFLDDRSLLFGTLSGLLKNLRITDQIEVETMGRYEKGIIAIRRNPNGKQLAIASGEGWIRIWERETIEIKAGSPEAERGYRAI